MMWSWLSRKTFYTLNRWKYGVIFTNIIKKQYFILLISCLLSKLHIIYLFYFFPAMIKTWIICSFLLCERCWPRISILWKKKSPLKRYFPDKDHTRVQVIRRRKDESKQKFQRLVMHFFSYVYLYVLSLILSLIL